MCTAQPCAESSNVANHPPVHRAHRVEVDGAWRALKYGAAFAHFNNQEIKRLGDGGVGQLAAQHGLHLLQTPLRPAI